MTSPGPLKCPHVARMVPDLRARLRLYAGPTDDPRAPEGAAQAAVSVILRSGPEPELLLVKRATCEEDPWSGHMALPGGRRDHDDPSLLHTAVRETAEETALSLDPGRESLGMLPVVEPLGSRIPRVQIAPFVFSVPRSVGARVNSPEIARIHWVPLSRFRDPEARGRLELVFEDGVRKRFPAFEIQGEKVWGLTYRILTDLLGDAERR